MLQRGGPSYGIAPVAHQGTQGDTSISLFKFIRTRLGGSPYYVRMRRDRLIVRNVSTGSIFDDEPLAGGISQIERRALHELLDSAGALEVHFWEGRELSDEELQSGVFRTTASRENRLP